MPRHADYAFAMLITFATDTSLRLLPLAAFDYCRCCRYSPMFSMIRVTPCLRAADLPPCHYVSCRYFTPPLRDMAFCCRYCRDAMPPLAT